MRSEYGLTDHEFTDISNVELQTCIERIVHTMPDAGQNMVKGILRGEGIHVSVTRIRECISEVNPINTTCTGLHLSHEGSTMWLLLIHFGT